MMTGTGEPRESKNVKSGHAVVREGILYEQVFDDTAVPRSLHDAAPDFEEAEDDAWDRDSDDDASQGTRVTDSSSNRQSLGWEKRDVLLFANGNLVIRPCDTKGFKIWPFHKSHEKKTKSRVVPLVSCTFRKPRKNSSAGMYTFEIVQNAEEGQGAVFGVHNESILENWFRDMLGVVSVTTDGSNGSQLTHKDSRDDGPTETEIFRAREAWLQAYFEMGAKASVAPKRYWNAEFSPKWLRGNSIEGFRIWRDFNRYALDYIRESGSLSSLDDAESESQNTRRGESKGEASAVTKIHPHVQFSSTFLPNQTLRESRMHDAMQLFYDAKGVLLILGDDAQHEKSQNKLQVGAPLILSGAERACLSPQKPLEEPSGVSRHIKVHGIKPAETVFNRPLTFENPELVQVLLLTNNGTACMVTMPKEAKARDASVKALLEEFGQHHHTLRLVHGGSRYIFLQHGENIPINAVASKVLGKTVRGNVVILPGAEDHFMAFTEPAALLRPEYPSCRLDLFREYFIRLNTAKMHPNSDAAMQLVTEAETRLAQDVVLTCTYAAASRLRMHASLIKFPRQVVTLLHSHGVSVTRNALRVFSSMVPKSVAKVVKADMALYECQGNIAAAAILLAFRKDASSPSEILHSSRSSVDSSGESALLKSYQRVVEAYLRLSGLMLRCESLLKGVGQISNVEQLTDHLDLEYEGRDRSYNICGSDDLYIGRLSRGLNRCTLRDQTNMTFKETPIRSRDVLTTAATILNSSKYLVEHNMSRYERRPQSSPMAASSLYAEMVGIIFTPTHQAHEDTELVKTKSKGFTFLSQRSKADAKSTSDAEAAKSEMWWVKPDIPPNPEAQASVAWIQVMLGRASVLTKNADLQARAVGMENIVSALESAEAMLQSPTSLLIVALCIARAALSSQIAYVVFALRVLFTQQMVECSKVEEALYNWLLFFPGQEWNTKDRNRILTMMSKIHVRVHPGPISRKRLLQKTILRKKPMKELVFETRHMVMSNDLDDLLQLYYEDRPTAGELPSRFALSNSLNALEQTLNMNQKSGKPHLNLGSHYSTRSARTDSEGSLAVPASGDVETHSGANPSEDGNEKANLIVMRGPPQGLSLEQEQTLEHTRPGMPQDNEDSSSIMSFGSPKQDKQASVSPVAMGGRDVLGFMTEEHILSPELLSRKIQIMEVSCGNRHTGIVTKGGLLLTFGFGGGGRLGHGDQNTSLEPTVVEYFVERNTFITKVACGRDHTVAIGTDDGVPGTVFSWGWGEAGRLGQGKDLGIEASPLLIENVKEGDEIVSTKDLNFIQAACGYEHTILLTNGGKVFTCGAGGSGRLGHNSTDDQLYPVRVLGNLVDEYIISVSAGDAHSLALSREGIVFSWGFGRSGALGHGDTNNRLEPKRIALLQDSRQVIQIGCGGYHSVALDSRRRVWTWGDAENGHLGILKTEPGENTIPRMVRFAGMASEGSQIVKIACGSHITLVVDSNQNVFQWGSPPVVQPAVEVPTKVFEEQKITFEGRPLIAAGAYHSIAIFSALENPVDFHERELLQSNSARKDSSLSLLSVATHRQTGRYASTTPSSSDRVLFCGSLDANVLEKLDGNSYEFKLRVKELELLDNKRTSVNRRSQTSALDIHVQTPLAIRELSGLCISSASGSAGTWYFTTKTKVMYTWGVDAPVSVTTPAMDILDIKTSLVASSSKGDWNAALVAAEDNKGSTNVFLWKKRVDRPWSVNVNSIAHGTESEPVLKWPLHSEMKLASVDLSSRRVAIADADGSLFEIDISHRSDILQEPLDNRPPPKERSGGSKKKGKKTLTVDLEMAERVRRFYLKYAPHQVRSNPAFLPTMLGLYRQKESDLLRLLVDKYGPEPSMREAMCPTGFVREFPRVVPTKLPAAQKIVQVACGEYHSLALTDSGIVLSWGDVAGGCALGVGDLKVKSGSISPQVVTFPSSETSARPLIAQIASGSQHSLAVSLGGSLYTWGDGRDGVLGHGDRSNESSPKQVKAFRESGISVAHIACGARHSAVVSRTGEAYTFGMGVSGALGLDNAQTYVCAPTQVHLTTYEDEADHDVVATNVFASSASTIFLGKIVR